MTQVPFPVTGFKDENKENSVPNFEIETEQPMDELAKAIFLSQNEPNLTAIDPNLINGNYQKNKIHEMKFNSGQRMVPGFSNQAQKNRMQNMQPNFQNQMQNMQPNFHNQMQNVQPNFQNQMQSVQTHIQPNISMQNQEQPTFQDLLGDVFLGEL